MKTNVQIAIPGMELVKEVNRIRETVDMMPPGLSDDGMERLKTTQLLALGALFFVRVQANPLPQREELLRAAWAAAQNLKVQP